MSTRIPPMSDAMAATIFTVVINDHKVWPMQREPKVIDPSAMDADELRACQRRERAERVLLMAGLVDESKKQGISLTDLIPLPTYI